MEISKEKYSNLVKLCNKRHKGRENSYGVCWCIRCGRLLSSADKKLENNDVLIIK